MAEFCEALQGRQSLTEALARFIRSVGAECGMIVRTHTNEMHPQRVAAHDERRADPVRPLVASYADGQFGRHLQRPRPASLWLRSVEAAEPGHDPHPALAEWQAARRLEEFAVLVLAAGPSIRDHIELHFRHQLSAEVQAAIAAVLPTMARSWAKRQVGVVTRTITCHRTRADALANRPVLGEANPHQLSRAEFRVCLLLSRGLSVEGVSAELGLAKSTVRSHLRSIYAKTGVTSLAELVFRLLDSREAEPRPTLRTA
ncbi:helix-turn-helix transcriptional regulator [Rhodobacter sp. CZR27]|uniref:helix-turn-helix transcriptional regulator n=1 Tax=Rhodobacter sp. CZR27 TaxID=2033869 RepID=UPI001E53AECB|nr:helix-turn-helix transcriptional regulator [Rhodobacter sp. CZR27]